LKAARRKSRHAAAGERLRGLNFSGLVLMVDGVPAEEVQNRRDPIVQHARTCRLIGNRQKLWANRQGSPIGFS
jgi:hypothetical protein